jgi:hypothetical protein
MVLGLGWPGWESTHLANRFIIGHKRDINELTGHKRIDQSIHL